MSIPRQETIHGDSNALTLTSDRRQKHGDPAWVPFAAGFTSGCTNVLAGHPFDTLRVRVQTGQSIAFTNPYHYASMLYRGILPPFITASMSISVNFGLWEAVRTTYTDPWITKSNKPLSPDESPVSSIFLSGTLTGWCVCQLTMPLVNMKVVRQTLPPEQVERTYAKQISRAVRDHGLQSLWRGYLPHNVQESVGRGCYLGGYYLAKRILADEQTFGEAKFWKKALAAAVGGIAGWCVTYPMDVLRSNMMRDYKSERYANTYSCLTSILKEHGVAGLYRGMGFTVVRAVPVAIFTLPVWDSSRSFFLRFAGHE